MINDEQNEEDQVNDEHDTYLEWDSEQELSIALTSEADKSFQLNYYFKKIIKYATPIVNERPKRTRRQPDWLSYQKESIQKRKNILIN